MMLGFQMIKLSIDMLDEEDVIAMVGIHDWYHDDEDVYVSFMLLLPNIHAAGSYMVYGGFG